MPPVKAARVSPSSRLGRAIKYQSWCGPLAVTAKGNIMTVTKYWPLAQECLDIAKRAKPEHCGRLKQIAELWLNRKGHKRVGRSGV